jgi:hypothetical protein
MSCLGYPEFYQPPLFPHFDNPFEEHFYRSEEAVRELEPTVNDLVKWVHEPASRPAGFNIKTPFTGQTLSLLKLAQTQPSGIWAPFIGILTDSLARVASEGGLDQVGRMSPWAKLFEALAVALPLAPEIQEAAEILFDYGNVDCRFKSVVMLGYTRLRDAPSFLLEVFEKEPVLNIRVNAIWSITKIGFSNAKVLNTLEDYFERKLFREVIAGNLYRFTGEWMYLDYLVDQLEEPHSQKTATLLDYLEPWPRSVCSCGGCMNPVWFKDYWWRVQAKDPSTSFYQAYSDYRQCSPDTDVCWTCFQETRHKAS